MHVVLINTFIKYLFSHYVGFVVAVYVCNLLWCTSESLYVGFCCFAVIYFLFSVPSMLVNMNTYWMSV